MIFPTWQDYFVKVATSAKSKAFSIKDGGTTIYSGTIYSKSGNNEDLYVNIMPIVRDYLSAVYPLPNMSNGTAYVTQPMYKTFEVKPASGTAVNVEVYYDYSYKVLLSGGNRTDNYANFRNDPIIMRFSPSQGLFYSHVKTKNISYDKIYPDGTSVTRSQTSTGCASAWGGEAYDHWSQFVAVESADFVTPDGRSFARFDIVGDCYRYALDYLNEWGGWDSLLIEGADKRTDDYRRDTYRSGIGVAIPSGVDINNIDFARRDKTEYLNTVTPRWELNTALLSDDEASRMHHLLGSPNVFLRDLMGVLPNNSYPVTIIDSACEYKRNVGAGWGAQYTINVELSHERMRR